MIIYFDYMSRIELLERFHKIANKDCRLYIGNSDIIPNDNAHFSKVFGANSATYYQKNEF